MSERILPVYILRMIGELGKLNKFSGKIIEDVEKENCVHLSLLLKLLDQCRGLFLEKKPGYLVWNLVNSIKEVKGDLIGMDLHALDLSGVGLNNIQTSLGNQKAVFDHSLLREQDLFPQGHNWRIYSVAYHPDGNRIISGSHDGSIKEWDTQTGECLRTYKGHLGWSGNTFINAVSYHPDGSRLISGSNDKMIKEWDTQTGECIRNYESWSWINSVAYNPDGNRIISGSSVIDEWDTQTGEKIHTYRGHKDHIFTLAYHPDGNRIISGSGNTVTRSLEHNVKEWDVQTRECIRTYEGHNKNVNSVAYHPNRNRLISGSDDGTVKEWDTQTGECIRTYEGFTSPNSLDQLRRIYN